MKLELITDFSNEETKILWNAGVNLDDWNFAVIGEEDSVVVREHWETKQPELKPADFTLERILESGGYDYKCYLVEFRGKKCAICVQYH